MAKFNGKYVIVCDCCDAVCGTYNRDTNELKCKSICQCGSNDLSYHSEAEYREALSGGLDADV